MFQMPMSSPQMTRILGFLPDDFRTGAEAAFRAGAWATSNSFDSSSVQHGAAAPVPGPEVFGMSGAGCECRGAAPACGNGLKPPDAVRTPSTAPNPRKTSERTPRPVIMMFLLLSMSESELLPRFYAP